VHPQLNNRYSFHSEAKKYSIKYDLKKKICSFVFRKAALQLEGANTWRKERGKGETGRQIKILGKHVINEFKLTPL